MLPSEYLKQGWTKNCLARDEHGKPTDELSTEATQWCMIGAMNAAYGQNGYLNLSKGCFELLDENAKIIHEKIFGKKTNIFKRIKNKIKYRSKGAYDIIAYWNDIDCKDQDEAIEVMLEAERTIGLAYNTKELCALQLSNAVDNQLKEIIASNVESKNDSELVKVS